MNADDLKQKQTPIKDRYRDDPQSAVVSMHATGQVDRSQLSCKVRTFAGEVAAGLHPAAGGEGNLACSGDMLLQALVACSGVTLAAVATAMGLPVGVAEIEAKGEMDFRGTLGVDRTAPVGLTAVELTFRLSTDPVSEEATDAQLDKLIQLTERYCVVMQSLSSEIQVTWNWTRAA